MNAKRLELLTGMAPGVRRVGVLANPANWRSTSQFLRAKDALSRTLGVQLDVEEVRTPEEIERAVAALARRGAGAVMELIDSLLSANRHLTIKAAAAHRLPAIYPDPEAVQQGGLAGLDENPEAHILRQAAYVDRVLRGAKPSELPIERPTTFEFTINLRTARALGLTIPPSVLARATKVID